jgi:poly-gamma-glutamate synthesis protein (capsule biosynthesis protein)
LVNRTRLNGRLADIDLGQLERQLAGCKQDAVDFSILQLHWGLEHEHYPTPDQVELAHHLAELGFDLVIGHHPHVAQPLELYRTARDPNRIVPIYYSLGNLVNPFSARHVSRSLVARLALVRGTCGDGATRTYVKHAAAIEVEQHADVHARELRLLRA